MQVNLLFLINIVRILLAKLRQGSTGFDSQSREGAHIFKALRAALILFPLLGITNLLFFINPKSGSQQKIYMLFNASMQSSQVYTLDIEIHNQFMINIFFHQDIIFLILQGIFLAVIYCFLNSEVKEKIKLHFERIQTRNDITRNYNSQAAIMTLTVVAKDGTATATKTTNDSHTKSEKLSLLISANGEHRKVKRHYNIRICVFSLIESNGCIYHTAIPNVYSLDVYATNMDS